MKPTDRRLSEGLSGLNPHVHSAPFSLEMVSVLFVDVLELVEPELELELELEPALQPATPAASTPAARMTPYVARRLMPLRPLLPCLVLRARLRPCSGGTSTAKIPGCPFRFNLLGQYPNYLSATIARMNWSRFVNNAQCRRRSPRDSPVGRRGHGEARPTSGAGPAAAPPPPRRARSGPVRGASLADQGDERAAAAGAHPPAWPVLAGRAGPGLRPVQAHRVPGPGQRRAGRPGPHRRAADRRARPLGPALRDPARRRARARPGSRA